MDFAWTEVQKELHERARRFGEEQTPGADCGALSREAWRRCGAFGLLGLSVPAEYGGMGLDALTTARAVEGFGRGCEDMGLVFSTAAHLFACAIPIADHASEPVKTRVLPRLCSGEWVGANASTETNAGSDAFAQKATAVRDGDEYVLNGTKTFVTNGPIADVFLVYASTNPKDGYLGLSAFVVERDTKGLVPGKPFEKVGLTSSPMSSLYLEDARVPSQNRLGKEGQGARVFQSSMLWERCCLFAAYVGVMDRQIERAVAHARARRQFGRSIGKNQAISHRIADMKLRLEAARLLLYRACWTFDQGEDAMLDISLSKIAVSEAAVQSSLDLIQIHGGAGVLLETGIEQMLRDSVPGTIFSGTSEMMRELVASRLGL
jgi:alkylation response protein AidB-like acyl-CoA dehydrogenase